MERRDDSRLYPIGPYAMGMINNLGEASTSDNEHSQTVHRELAIGYAQSIIRHAIDVGEPLPEVFRQVADMGSEIRKEVFKIFGIALQRIKDTPTL